MLLKKIIILFYKFFYNIYFIKLIRYNFFTLLGHITRIFVSYSETLPKNEVVILGRGKSLNEFKKNYKKYNICKNICLINFDDNDLKDFNINILNNKIVHFFINSSEPTISIFNLNKILVGKSYFMRSRNDALLDQKYFNSKKIGNYIEYLPDNYKNLINKYNNSGLLAISIVAEKWKTKNIHLFGFNFYQDEMHNNTLKKELQREDHIQGHIAHGKIMKKQLKSLIEKNKGINFYQH